MNRINVVYWSQSGNTKAMAEAVGVGIAEAGAQPAVVDVAGADLDELKEAKVFALGCPAMGAEVLEESEMEPFVEAVTTFVAGKTVALFGSYGWGDGEWMRDWVSRMEEAGAEVLFKEGVICLEMPDESTLAKCKEAGKQLVALA